MNGMTSGVTLFSLDELLLVLEIYMYILRYIYNFERQIYKTIIFMD